MDTPGRTAELERKFAENARRYFAALANEYRKNGELERAIELCQRHLAEQRNHLSGHVVLAQALVDAGREQDAWEPLHTALELDPENVIALRLLGDLSAAAGELEQARDYYFRVLDIEPRNDQVITSLKGLGQRAPVEQAPGEPEATPAQAGQETQPAEGPSWRDWELQTWVTPGYTSVPSAAEKPIAESDGFDSALQSDASQEPIPAMPDSGRDPVTEGAGAAESAEPQSAREPAAGATAADPIAAAPPPFDATAAAQPEDVTVGAEPAEDAAAAGAFLQLEPTLAEPGELFAAEIPGEGEPAAHAEVVEEVEGSREAEILEEAASVEAEIVEEVEFSLREEPPAAEIAEAAASLAASSWPPDEELPAETGEERAPESRPTLASETMVDLYLQQGHTQLALSTLRDLAGSRPDDERLKARVEELERASAPPPRETVRDLFARIGRRRSAESEAATALTKAFSSAGDSSPLAQLFGAAPDQSLRPNPGLAAALARNGGEPGKPFEQWLQEQHAQ